jgi:hypothetical protein
MLMGLLRGGNMAETKGGMSHSILENALSHLIRLTKDQVAQNVPRTGYTE